MKTKITFPYSEPATEFEVEINYGHILVGYGQYKILADVTYLGKTKQFRHYMTDAKFIDKIRDMETVDQAQGAYSTYLHHMDEHIAEWCMDVLEAKEADQ